MKNLLFLQAFLLASIHAVVAEEANSLRGAIRAEKEPDQNDRALRMGKKSDYSYSSDEEYYYGKGKGEGKGKGGGKKGGKKGGKGKGKGKGNARYVDYYEDHSDDGYYPADDGYYSSGKKGGYYYEENHPKYPLYPTVEDINFLDDEYFDDHFFEDDDCELVTLNETFTIPRASRFLAPDTTPEEMGDPTLIGTVFIWENQQISEPNGEVPIVGTRVSGTCTRTTPDSEGMGSCQLIFVDDDEYSINIDGLLTGPFGSQLAITGGTGGMVGVIGEMDFFPVFNEGEFDGDIFINVTRYEVEADLGLIICPSYH